MRSLSNNVIDYIDTRLLRFQPKRALSVVSLPKRMSSNQHSWPVNADMARSPGVSQGRRMAEQFNLSPMDRTCDDHTDVQVTKRRSRHNRSECGTKEVK